jgi:hypothetical protein
LHVAPAPAHSVPVVGHVPEEPKPHHRFAAFTLSKETKKKIIRDNEKIIFLFIFQHLPYLIAVFF